MKKALLVNPWIYDFKAFDFFLKPLGLLYLASYLRKFNFQISFLDCLDRYHPFLSEGKKPKVDSFGRGKFISRFIPKPVIYQNIPRRYKRYGLPIEDLERTLNEIERPDYIFLTSIMTYWYPGVIATITLLRKYFPKTPIILGGIYATLCFSHAQKFSGANLVISGPFETELYKYLPGLKPIPFSELPFPAYDLYKKLDYVSILTSRGCPFRCTYCAVPRLFPEFQFRKKEEVIAEIDYYRELGIKNIAFTDDALLCHPEIKTLLKELAKKNWPINFHTPNGLHPRFLDREIAHLLFSANFKTVYLSLETASPSLQKRTGDKVRTEEFIRAVQFLREAGFDKEIHTYLIFGLPEQTLSDIKESIDLVLSLGIKCHLAEFSPIPGTEEYKKIGFDEKTDPLYHNNTALFYLTKKEEFLKMKTYLQQRDRSISS
ncbi:MAG: B12-binding domain-containing radical SAM protein [candidate division WOR-3 bacterium]